MKRAIERRTQPRVGVIKRVEDITYQLLRAEEQKSKSQSSERT